MSVYIAIFFPGFDWNRALDITRANSHRIYWKDASYPGRMSTCYSSSCNSTLLHTSKRGGELYIYAQESVHVTRGNLFEFSVPASCHLYLFQGLFHESSGFGPNSESLLTICEGGGGR